MEIDFVVIGGEFKNHLVFEDYGRSVNLYDGRLINHADHQSLCLYL
jgi:hypothetical protein